MDPMGIQPMDPMGINKKPVSLHTPPKMNSSNLKLFQEPPYSQVPAVSVSGVCLRFHPDEISHPRVSHQVALRCLDRDERFCAVRGLEQEAKVSGFFNECVDIDLTHKIHGTNGIFTYIWLICMVNVGTYIIHGLDGMECVDMIWSNGSDLTRTDRLGPKKVAFWKGNGTLYFREI